MPAGTDIRIRWLLDVVDRGGPSKLLAQDREIRASLGQTDTAYGRVANSAARSSEKQASASRLASTALTRQGDSTSRTATATSEYVASQREALSVGTRVVAQSDKVAGAYDRQAAAARRVAAEQGRLAKLTKASAGGIGGVLGGAGSVLAAGGKVIGGTALGLLATATGLTVGGLKRGTEIRAGAAGIQGISGVDPRTATALAVIANAEQVQPRGLGQAFSTLGKQVVSLQQEIAKGKPGKATEGFQTLGISPGQVKGLQNNLPALFDLVFARAQKLPAAQQAATLKTFLGRGASLSGQVELAGPLSKQVAAVREQLGGLDPGKLEKLHETEIRLKEASVGLELSFAQTFGPPLISIFNKLAPAIKPFGDILKTAITVPLEWIKKEGPGILDTFTKGVKGETPKTQKPLPSGPTVPLTTTIGGPNTPRLVPQIGPRPPSFGKGHVRGSEPFSEEPAPIEKEPSKLEQITRKAGEIAKTIGSDAQRYGQQLLEAFQPAIPFFQNVLLPVLEGTGKGIGAAFAIALPIIRTTSEALGKLAQVVGPLTPELKVFGAVLGVALAGPALKKLSDVGKIGPLFSVMRLPLIAAGGALKGFGVAADVAGGLFAKLPGRLGRVTSGLIGHAGDWARALGDSLQGSPKKLATLARESASSFTSALGRSLGKAKAAGKAWAGAVIEGMSSVLSKAREIVSKIPGIPAPGGAGKGAEKGAAESATKGAENVAEQAGGGAAGGFIAGWLARIKGAGRIMGGALRGAFLVVARAAPWAIVAVGATLFAKELVGVFQSGFSAIGKIRFPRFIALEHVVQETKRLPGQIASVASGAAGSAAKIASSVAHGIAGLPGKLAHSATSAGSSLIHKLNSYIDDASSVGSHIASSVAHGVSSVGSKIAGIGKSLFNGLFNLGYEIVKAIVKGIESTPGAIWNAIKGLAGKAGGAIGSVVEKLNPFGRKGGVLHSDGFRRYQGGGMVDAFVSPGEAVVYGNSTWTVPGRPTAADSVFAQLPVGAAVLTGDGQQMMSEGASMSEAVARQAPHFRAGGLVVKGRVSTFGPPNEAAAQTATGVSDSEPGVAIRPGATYQSGEPYKGRLWQISIKGHVGNLKQIDIGPNQSTGRRIDVTGAGAAQLGIDPRQFPTDAIGTATLLSGSSASGAAEKLALETYLGRSRTRAGLLSDALQQGIDAGKAGLTGEEIAAANRGRRGAVGSPLTAAIAEAVGAVTKTVTIASAKAKAKGKKTSAGGPSHLALGGTEKGGTFAGVRVGVANMAREVLKANPGLSVTSTTGGTHATNSLHYQGRAVDVAGSNMNTAADWLKANYGRVLTEGIHNPNLSIKYGKEVAPSFWGSSTWAEHLNHIHMALRRGGIVRRFRKGGGVGGGGSLNELAGGLTRLDKTAGTSKFQAALASFEETLEGLSTKRLNQLVVQLTRAARKGGGAKVVKSFQAAIDAIEGKIGLRIGELEQNVSDRSAALARGQGAVDRSLRARGIDASSVSGLNVQIGFDDKSVAARKRSVAEAKQAVKEAQSTHNKAAIREATEGLTTAEEELDEAVTKGIEDRRALIRQAAQDVTDQAQFGVESTQNALSGLDISQKLNRTAETPGGLQAKAREIEGKLIPALQSSVSALNSQLGVLEATGASGSELNAVRLQIQSAGNDIGNAMVEAADDVRQAAETASEEIVEKASHRGTLASTGLQKLEIEQRLAGTFDNGGVQRADFIKSEVIPALEAERQALTQRKETAETEGNQKLAEQIAEQMAAKNNDILSAQLEVQQQIEANTNPNHKVGGTLGFAFGSESVTDSIISVGSGA
jgi:hypothetical protein